jgi:hypothetical protein
MISYVIHYKLPYDATNAPVRRFAVKAVNEDAAIKELRKKFPNAERIVVRWSAYHD